MVLELQSIHHTDNRQQSGPLTPDRDFFKSSISKIDSPRDDTWYIWSSQTFDGSIDLQVLLQSDPGPQWVHLWTVAYVLQRTVCVVRFCAVISHQHLHKKTRLHFNDGTGVTFSSVWVSRATVPDLLSGQCHLTACASQSSSLLRWGPAVQELHLETESFV